MSRALRNIGREVSARVSGYSLHRLRTATATVTSQVSKRFETCADCGEDVDDQLDRAMRRTHRGRRRLSADRVEPLLQAMTLEEKVAQLGSRWVTANAGRTRAIAEVDTSLNVAPMQDVSPPPAAPARGGEPARAGPPDPGLRQRPVSPADRARPSWSASSTSFSRTPGSASRRWSTRSASPASPPTAPPSTRRPSRGAPPSTPTWSSGWPRRSAATWPRSACTRASRPSSTSCATTAGAGSRRPSARTPTWSRCSAPPTCAACRAPASRHAQALRRLLRLARRPQPRPGVDGPPRAVRRDPAAVRDGRRARPAPRSVMNSYSDIDGVPAGADPWLLTEVLRDEWGFDGTVVSDYWAVPFLATHAPRRRRLRRRRRARARGRDRRRAARHPRVRRRTSSSWCAAGSVDEELVDRAARRAADPEGRARPARPRLDARGLGARRGRGRPRLRRQPRAGPGDGRAVDRAARRRHRAAAARRRTARRCSGSPSSARAPTTRRRSWAATPSPTTCCRGTPATGSASTCRRALDALRAELPGVELVHEPGCAVQGDDRSGFAAAVEAARDADLCVALVGDLAGLFGHGTSGEGCDVEDLRLPGVQAELLEELLATGTPVVVVVVSGRPYALGEHRPARRRPRAGLLARRGGRRRDRRRPLRPGAAERQAAGADPAAPRRAASHLPAAAARRRRERRHHHPRPAPAVPLRLRRVVHLLRARRPAAERGGDADRRRGRRSRSGSATPARARRRGRAALPARRRRPGRPPGEPLVGFARVELEAGARRDVVSACTPTAPPTPDGTSAPRRAGRHPATARHLGGRPAGARDGARHRPDPGRGPAIDASHPRRGPIA